MLLRLGELVGANVRLEDRVVELERRLNRSSPLPPSQDPLCAATPGGKGSGRGRGGKPGYEGRYGRLLPPERVDEVVEYHVSPALTRAVRSYAGIHRPESIVGWRATRL